LIVRGSGLSAVANGILVQIVMLARLFCGNGTPPAAVKLPRDRQPLTDANPSTLVAEASSYLQR